MFKKLLLGLALSIVFFACQDEPTVDALPSVTTDDLITYYLH